jgi:hypothetical protein
LCSCSNRRSRCAAELRRLASRLQTLSPEQQAAVEALTRGLVNKFLHQPVQAIKAAASEGNAPRWMPSAKPSGFPGGDAPGEEEPFEATHGLPGT